MADGRPSPRPGAAPTAVALRRRPGRHARLAAWLLLAASGCAGERSQTLVVVDTNLPVPGLAARLRVDVYEPPAGQALDAGPLVWTGSRDLLLAEPGSWPTSFTVAGDEAAEREVVLRLRAYPEGAVRDYRGERFHPRPAFSAPTPPRDLGQLCSSEVEVTPGQVAWLATGRAPFLPPLLGGTCAGQQVASGAAAAVLQVKASGRYRMVVLGSSRGDAVSLQVRTSCEPARWSSATVEACFPSVRGPDTTSYPDLTLDLLAGKPYHLIFAIPDTDSGPTELSFLAAPVGAFEPRVGATSPALASTPDPVPSSPLALREGPTPAEEPEPRVAVDRLVRVRTSPGRKQAVLVLLDGACAGTMARLATGPLAQQAVAAEMATCVDREGERQPLGPAPLISPAEAEGPPLAGTFGAGEACPPDDPASPYVCLPGGPFVLGGPDGAPGLFGSSRPPRAAVLSTFWIDRDEVSVRSWRGWSGRRRLDERDLAIDNPIEIRRAAGPDLDQCSFSAINRGREDYSLSCVPWQGARAFCQAAGGDLPTAAQFERASAGGVGSRKRRFPWGDAPWDCQHAVCLRGGDAAATCVDDDLASIGPQPPGTAPGDRTPEGVLDLGGGLTEWALDALRPFDHPCWDSAPLRDPRCYWDDAVWREMRGTSWEADCEFARGQFRAVGAAPGIDPRRGFRCAYPARPAP